MLIYQMPPGFPHKDSHWSTHGGSSLESTEKDSERCSKIYAK